MKYLRLKDRTFRVSFLKNEKKFKVLKFVFTNLLNKKDVVKKNVIFHFLKLNKKNIKLKKLKARIRNRCVETGTSRSVSRSFKVSRRNLRNLLSFGILPGYRKSV
jgi:ribosomal protein S14